MAICSPSPDSDTRTAMIELARLSVAFASGQIAGPLLVRVLDGARSWGLDALDGCHALATLALLASAAWLWRGAGSSTRR